MPRGPVAEAGTIKERFFKRVEVGKKNECWLWKGYQSAHNWYGRMNVVGRGMLFAHRVSWEVHFGEVPKGMVVMHLCNNKICVNPRHLKIGTQYENIHMAMSDGLIKKPYIGRTHCRNGHEYDLSIKDRRGFKLCIVCKPRVRRYYE